MRNRIPCREIANYRVKCRLDIVIAVKDMDQMTARQLDTSVEIPHQTQILRVAGEYNPVAGDGPDNRLWVICC